jgi:hypothetical protein
MIRSSGENSQFRRNNFAISAILKKQAARWIHDLRVGAQGAENAVLFVKHDLRASTLLGNQKFGEPWHAVCFSIFVVGHQP